MLAPGLSPGGGSTQALSLVNVPGSMTRIVSVLLSLAFLCATGAYAQIGFQSPAVVNAAPNSISYCEPDPTGFFEINWKVNGAVSEGFIEVVVPTGARFIPGSKEDINTVPAGIRTSVLLSGDTLRFALNNRSDGDEGTIRYKLFYDCRVDSVFQTPYEMPVRAITGADTFAIRATPINSTGSIPIVTPRATASTTLRDVIVGETRTREFDIVQSGQQSRAYSFLLCGNYGGNLSVTDRTLAGVPLSFPNANGGCVNVTQAAFPDLPWPFTQGERWTFRETVTVGACGGSNTVIQTRFGCGPAMCQEFVALPLEIQFENAPPALTTLRHERTLPESSCTADGATMESEFRLTGKAYNARFRLVGFGDGVYVDTNTVVVDWGDGTYRPWTDGYVVNEGRGSQCAPGRWRDGTTAALPAVIDATAEPRVIRVRYQVKWCCEARASGDLLPKSIYGSNTSLLVEDQCGAVQRRETWDYAWSLDASGSSDFPAAIADGDTLSWVIDIDDMIFATELRANAEICVEYVLPAGLQPIPGAPARYLDSYGANASEGAVTSLPGGRYRACFTDQRIHFNGSTIGLPVRYQCTAATSGQVVTTTATVSTRLGAASCTAPDECDVVFFTVAGQTLLGDECTSSPCDGLVQLGTELRRETFGTPDADRDGCPDPGAALDMALVRDDHAMIGDVVRATTTALVRLSAPGDELRYVTVDARWSTPHADFGEHRLEIVDASSGATFACALVDVAAVDSTGLRYRLQTTTLAGCGSVPSDFTFADGDTLRLRSDFGVRQNPGCDVEETLFRTDWYADRGSNAGADRLQCNGPTQAKYKNIGYLFDLRDWLTREYGCAGTRYEARASLCVGGSTFGSPFWPGEIREYGILRETRMEVPPGMRLDSIVAINLNTTRAASFKSWSDGLDLMPYATVADGFVSVDWSGVRADCDAFKMRPGSGFVANVRAYFEGSCASERITPRIAATASYDFPQAGGLPGGERVEERTQGYPVRAGIPAAELASASPDIAPFDERATWPFTLREAGAAVMPNAWVAFRSPNGTLAPREVTFAGAVITPVEGIYRLGDLPASSVSQFVVTAGYGSCGADSLEVITGWDCGGYPTSATDVLSGGAPCTSEALTLRMLSQTPGIQQAIVKEPLGRTEPCSDLLYEVELLNTTPAVIYEPIFELYVPYTAGIEVIPGSERAAYPSTVAPGEDQFDTALGAPMETIVTPLGIKYIWDLEALFDEFDADSDKGWGGLAAEDENARRISIQFEARTNCAFIGGDFLNFITRGRSYCGAPARTVVRNGQQIEFIGVESPYAAVHEFDVPERLDACSAEGLVELDARVTFFAETDGGDQIFLALPPALEFVRLDDPSGSLDTNVTVNQVGPIPGSDVYFEELRIRVAPGLESFAKTAYTVVTRVRPSGLLCDDVSTAYLRSVRDVSYECRGETCVGFYASGTLLPAPEFDLVPDTFAVSDLTLATNCLGDSLSLTSLTVTNETTEAITAPITVDIYSDGDGDGVLSPGDVLVASFGATPEAGVGESVTVAAAAVALEPGAELDACGLIGVVSGCTCEQRELPVTSLAVDNAGADGGSVCSGEPAALGCSAGLPGYTYRWAPAAGSPVGEVADETAAFTSVTYDSPERGTTTLTYVLTSTSPGGCVSADTVSVDVRNDCTTIGNFTWIDADADGLQGAGEPGLPDVTVRIYEAATGRVLDSTRSNALGIFGFEGFDAGDYYLVFDASTSALGEAYEVTVTGADPLAPDDSNADAAGRTADFAFDPLDGSVAHIDAGFLPTGEIAAVLNVGDFAVLDGEDNEVRLRLSVMNLGTGPVGDIEIAYDLAADFGDAFVSARVEPAAESPAAGTAVSAPALRTSFDGESETGLVTTAPEYRLLPGEAFQLDVFVRFDPRLAADPIETRAEVRARAALDAESVGATTFADLSDGGDDPRTSNPGAPGDTGGSDDPLPITCSDAAVTIAGDGLASCAGAAVTLRAEHGFGGAATYLWEAVDQARALGTDVALSVEPDGGEESIRLTVRGDGNACLYNLSAEASVTAGVIPTLLTPDDNNENDLFRIPCIEGFPGTGLTVYNRWGDAVFEAEDYRNDWGGTYEGDLLPEGTYFYLLDIASEPTRELIKGYVYIKH